MPISEKQRQIMAFPFTGYDAIICDGAIRSGKTSFMMVSFVDDAMRRYNHQRFAICGKTVDSTVKNIVAPYLALNWANEKYQLSWKRTDKILVVSDGERENIFEVFGGKDEASFMLIQGRTLAGVLLDEVALQPRSFVEQALARCSVAGSKLWFNCNPGPPSHWFYKEWICNNKAHNALHLHFLLEDNPALDDKIRERYHSMYAGVFYRRYILGEWCVAEGLVYPMFDKEKHVTDQIHGSGSCYISIDYGTLNPTAMGLWRVNNGSAVMVKEYYYSGRDSKRQKTDEEYYADLEEFAKGYTIDRVIVDPSAASFKETIRRHGKFFVMDAKNSVLDGIRLMGSLLMAGKLKFSPECVHTFEEFGAYCWDDKSQVDAVIKENDHSMDQSRYLCSTVLRREL